MVFKEMKRAAVIAAMESNGCFPIREGAEHSIYGCPCGKHRTPLPRHRKISPGVVNSIE